MDPTKRHSHTSEWRLDPLIGGTKLHSRHRGVTGAGLPPSLLPFPVRVSIAPRHSAELHAAERHAAYNRAPDSDGSTRCSPRRRMRSASPSEANKAETASEICTDTIPSSLQ